MAGEPVTVSASQASKTPIEIWVELKELVESLERDAQKATRGMKAGGIRLRASLQEVKEKVMELRRAVLDHRISRGRTNDESEESDDSTDQGADGSVSDGRRTNDTGASNNGHRTTEKPAKKSAAPDPATAATSAATASAPANKRWSKTG